MKTLLTSTLVLLLAAIAPAQTVTLGASADAFVSAANPTSNYGGAGALAVSAAGLSKGEFDSLLQFNFAPAKASFDALFGVGNWSLVNVSLSLTAAAPGNALFNGNGAGPSGTNVNSAGLIAFKWIQNDSWAEGTGIPTTPTTNGITFASLPGILSVVDEALGSVSFNGATSGTVAYPFGLTPAFVADATAGNLVSFLAFPGDSGVAALVNSRSVSNTAFQPMLTVIAVPEPGSGALLLTGLLIVVMRRREPRSDV